MHQHYKKRVRSQGNSRANFDELTSKCIFEGAQQVQEVQFDSQFFKTQSCQLQHPLSQRKLCPYYHDESDRRRDPKKYIYKCIYCPDKDMCKKGDTCEYAHNKVEQVYHPNRYKTKICTSGNDCEYGVYCSFAHNENELKIPIILHKMNQNHKFWMYHYKTVWCPFTQQHDRASCVYAHNPQDFRRDPDQVQPIDCPKWNKSSKVQNYEEGGCKDMMNCPYCHGWKELEYHPLVYKTKQCTAHSCTKQVRECAFYHNEQDRRIKKQQSDGKWIIEEPQEPKLIPYKRGSNFNGPIIPIYQSQINPELQQQKMEVGQPLELFSVQSNTKETDSRKNSIESYTFKPQQHRYQQQQQQQHKKHRTAPVTPNQKDFPISNPYLEGTHFSKKFYTSLFKKSDGRHILQVLEGLKIPETALLAMSKSQLIVQTKLTQQQLAQLEDVIQEIKYDQKSDQQESELLNQAITQFQE